MNPLRVCLVYDCLFPWTIGGAERWYRALAERLAAAGHEVTYLTLRQWERNDAPAIPGVRVVAVGPRLPLYAGDRRRIWPPLRFGLGVGWHLLRHGRGYDVVHIAAFPYFGLLAAALARRRGDYRLVVDWWEVWPPAYWRSYLGQLGGVAGWLVQRACARVDQRAFCFSRLQARRLRQAGFRGEATLLGGVASDLPAPREPTPAEPFVLFAGRHIPDKRVTALIPALVEARRTLPELLATIVGDGPERDALTRLIAAHGLTEAVDRPGFVEEATLDRTLRRALCLVLPSRREGFGLVVVEAAARGVPSVVVRAPNNAATELIVEGVNGFVAPSAAAADLAAAIVRVHAAGMGLREATAAWFAANAERLSLNGSLPEILAAYANDEPTAGPNDRSDDPSLESAT